MYELKQSYTTWWSYHWLKSLESKQLVLQLIIFFNFFLPHNKNSPQLIVNINDSPRFKISQQILSIDSVYSFHVLDGTFFFSHGIVTGSMIMKSVWRFKKLDYFSLIYSSFSDRVNNIKNCDIRNSSANSLLQRNVQRDRGGQSNFPFEDRRKILICNLAESRWCSAQVSK